MKAIVSLFTVALALTSCGPEPQRVRTLVPETLADFLPKRPEKGTVFRYYEARGRSGWSNNWAGSLDLTGVSWNNARTATLVSPSHVVMAAHFIRPADVPVMFHDKNGNPHERFIAGVRNLSQVGDVAVAKLNRPLPPEVRHYRFVTPEMSVTGRPVLITDQTRTVSIHRIARVSGRHIGFDYHPTLDPAYRRNLIVGDSGNPTFLLESGELRLLQTHTTGGPGAGPFYGDPGIQAAIRDAIAELGE